MIEKRYSEKIVEVQQQISAVILSPEIAHHVKATPGTTGLQTLRRYIGRNDRVLEVTISIHPSDRFRYDQKIRLEYGRGSAREPYRMMNGFVALDFVAIQTDFTCKNSLIPSIPLSRPSPLRL